MAHPTVDIAAKPMEGVRLLSLIERWLGSALAALGAVLFLIWWTGRAGDRHGMIFVYLGGTFVLPLGLALLLAGLGLTVRGRGRWLGQLFPILWPFVYRALFAWHVLP